MKDKSKHLEFVQNIITRMAANSFILKGWTITLISILFALAINNSDTQFIILAIFPAFVFWGLDSYYLRQERLFRKLYDYTRKTDLPKNDSFSLDTRKFSNKVDSWFITLFSSTVMLLHGMIIILIVVMMIFIK